MTPSESGGLAAIRLQLSGIERTLGKLEEGQASVTAFLQARLTPIEERLHSLESSRDERRRELAQRIVREIQTPPVEMTGLGMPRDAKIAARGYWAGVVSVPVSMFYLLKYGPSLMKALKGIVGSHGGG
jgi:hypothetical protein